MPEKMGQCKSVNSTLHFFQDCVAFNVSIRQAMDALRRQRERDVIAKSIAQMEAGEGISIEYSRKQTSELLLSHVR